MNKIFSMILFFLIQYSYRCNSVIDQIGNYSKLNPKNCGISRLSADIDSVCFEWHEEPLPLMRNATIGEVPWMVMIMTDMYHNESSQLKMGKGVCGGTVIANQWILTAAHCVHHLSKGEPIEVFSGYDFHLTEESNSKIRTTKKFIHPKYDGKPTSAYDICLVKLNKPISNKAKSICLPKKRKKYQMEPTEYGIIAGWSSRHLQLSYWKINTSFKFPRMLNHLYAQRLNNQIVCKGDSGSPLWQYHQGRAVIIGVASAIPMNITSNCMLEDQYIKLGYNDSISIPLGVLMIPISNKIDWIMSVTGLK